MYVDDIAQIITQTSKPRKFMARKIESEINNTNNYENQWIIKTNTTKFKIVPPAASETKPVTVEATLTPYAKKRILLGLHFNRKGIMNHLKHNKKKAKQHLGH